MTGKPRKSRRPDFEGLSLSDDPTLPGGTRVRELISGDLLWLLCNKFQSGERFTNSEMKWALDSLLWLNWHAGKVMAKAQMEGIGLHAERPLTANR